MAKESKKVNIQQVDKDIQTLNGLAGDDQAFELWDESQKDAFDRLTTGSVDGLIKALRVQDKKIKDLKVRSNKHMELELKIAKFYEDDSEGDLCDIGEVAASHFNFM